MSDLPNLIAGVDEVGRGAIFGPVVAAAVLVPEAVIPRLWGLGINDSKKLTARRRQSLVWPIRQLILDCQIGYSSAQEIDRLNILQASLLAMKRAVKRLEPRPNCCFVDGNHLIPGLSIEQQAWTKGDAKHGAIAAASIIAKVWRDNLIVRLDRRYPGYALASNKGYGSAQHRSAIRQLGLSRQHRRSFRCCKPELPPQK